MSNLYRGMAGIEAPQGFPIGSYRLTIAPGTATLHVGFVPARLFFGSSRDLVVDAQTSPRVSIRQRRRFGGEARFHRANAPDVVMHLWGSAERFAGALAQAGFVVSFDSTDHLGRVTPAEMGPQRPTVTPAATVPNSRTLTDEPGTLAVVAAARAAPPWRRRVFHHF